MEAISASLNTSISVPRGNKKRTITNFFSLSLLQLGNYVLPMLSLPIISRIIGPENYGLINYAFAFVGYFVLFINAGFDLYGTRQIVDNKENPEAISIVFSRIIISKAVLFLISTVIFMGAIYFVPQLRDQKALGWFTFLVCIGWVINPSLLFHGMQESKNYAFFSFISKLLFTILVLVLVRQREDYILQPLIFSLAHILISAVSFYYLFKKYSINIKKN
jgi:O-antigen/teichoic acid export membrane protein